MRSKKDIRQELLTRRKALKEFYVQENSMKIVDAFLKLDEFRSAKHMMTYASYPKEVQTDPLIIKSFELGKEVITPKCDKEKLNLIPIKIKGLHQLEKSFFGLREPNNLEDAISPSVLDIVVVPGVAFDLHGNRIGHGAGYYDHFLKHLPSTTLKVALAFSYQVIKEHWRIDPWDIPVDVIVTENGIVSVR